MYGEAVKNSFHRVLRL